MHYSNNPGKVRVDYFKPSGKWYETLEVDMTGYYDAWNVREAVRLAVTHQYESFSFDDWTVVCLEPYHKFSHPVMFKAKDF